jgi:ribosome-binding factor A
MPSHRGGGDRAARVAEVLRQELGRALLTSVKDPRLSQVNITRVRVTRDLSQAYINYLVIGVQDYESPKGQRALKQIERALESASGFLRREVGKNLEMRIVPHLHFYWDSGMEHGRKMTELLGELVSDQGESS